MRFWVSNGCSVRMNEESTFSTFDLKSTATSLILLYVGLLQSSAQSFSVLCFMSQQLEAHN